MMRPFVWVALIVLASTSAAAAPAGTMSLNEAYRLALAQSEQVQQSVTNRQLADATYSDAATLYAPNIAINATGFAQNRAVGSLPNGLPATGSQQPYGTNIRASVAQPIFHRPYWDIRRQSKYGVDSAQMSVVRARQQLMFDVATAFIGVLQARQQFVIGQGAVKRAQTQLESAVLRVNAGGQLKTAELLAQIDLNRAQTQLNTADGNIRVAESQLQRLIGVPPPDQLTLPPTPQVGSVGDAIDRSRDLRADLKSLHYSTLQQRAKITQLEDQVLWPTFDVNLYAGYVINGNASGNIVGNPSDFRFPTYGLSGTLTIPLFQGGDEYFQIRMQRYRAAMAHEQELYAWRQVQDDVRESISRVDISVKGMTIADEQQAAALQNYTLTARQYRLGVGTLLDLVTAQAAVFEAETNRVLAVYERELASYQLLFAEGKIDL